MYQYPILRRVPAYLVVLSAIAAAVLPSHAGQEFSIRKITNFSATADAEIRPIGTINDRLLFSAILDDQPGIYRTDGTNVELVENSSIVPLDFARYWLLSDPEDQGFPVVQIDGDLVFAAARTGEVGFYAVNDKAVRKVTDQIPPVLFSRPSDYFTVNDHFFFTTFVDNPGPNDNVARSIRTDGTNVDELPVVFDPLNLSRLPSGQIVFVASSFGTDTGGLYTTDGPSLTKITTASTPAAQLAGAGAYAYYTAGAVLDRSLYRTDGQSTEFIANLSDFTFTNQFDSFFGIGENLFASAIHRSDRELHLYRTNGETPVEVAQFADVTRASLFFSTDELAFLSIRVGDHDEIWQFDGQSITSLGKYGQVSSSSKIFTAFGDRVFLADSPIRGFESKLYEVVDGQLVPLGPAMEFLTQFEGELIGANRALVDEDLKTTLWRSRQGELEPLDVQDVFFDFQEPWDEITFIEFNGQLYFNGSDGESAQLFAIFPVPEPHGGPVIVIAMSCLTLFARFGWRSTYVDKKHNLACTCED